MMNDRSTMTPCGPDALQILFLDLLAVEIRWLPRALMTAWLQSCADCLVAMPNDHLRRRAFQDWLDRIFSAWPGYPGGKHTLRRDLVQIIERVRQKDRA